jgi:hypothetical protein
MEQKEQNTGFVLDVGSYVMPKPGLTTQAPGPGQAISPPPPVQGFQLDLSSYVVPKLGGIEEAIPPQQPKPSFADKALGAVGGALANIGRQSLQGIRTVGSGIYGGIGNITSTLDKLAEKNAEKEYQVRYSVVLKEKDPIEKEKMFAELGPPDEFKRKYKPKFFEKVTGLIANEQAKLAETGIPITSNTTNEIIRKVLGGLGSASIQIPFLMSLGPAGLPAWGAVSGYAEGGETGAIIGGIEGSLTLGIIKGIGILPSKVQLPAWFGFGAATTPGDLKERTVGALTWAALGVTGRKGKITVNDFIENYPKLKARIDESHAWKAIKEIAPDLTEEAVAAAGGPKAALENAIAYKDKVVSLMAAFQKAGLDPIKMMENPQAAEAFGQFVLEARPKELSPAPTFLATGKGTVFKPGTPEAVELKVGYREAETGQPLTKEQLDRIRKELAGRPVPAPKPEKEQPMPAAAELPVIPEKPAVEVKLTEVPDFELIGPGEEAPKPKRPIKEKPASKTPLKDFLVSKGGISLTKSEEAKKWKSEFKDIWQSKYWNMLRKNGLDSDIAAQLAQEAGFIVGNDPTDLLDALKREIGGKPQWSSKTREAELAAEKVEGPTKEDLEDVRYRAEYKERAEKRDFSYNLFLDGQKLDPESETLAREKLAQLPEEEMQTALDTRRLNAKRNELLEKTGYKKEDIKQFIDNAFLDGEQARKTAKRVLDNEITEEKAVQELKDDIEVAKAAATGGAEYVEPTDAMEHATAPVSQEAINRNRTIEFFMYDSRSKSIRPLPGLDAVDIQPKEFEIKVERNKATGESNFIRGEGALTPTHEIERLLKPTPERPKPAVPPIVEKEGGAADTVYMAVRNKQGEVITTLSQEHDGTFEGMIKAGRELVAKAGKETPDFSRDDSSFMVTDETGEHKYSITPNLRHVKNIQPEKPAPEKAPVEEKPFSLAQEAENKPKPKAPEVKQEKLFTEPVEKKYPAGFDNRGIRKWRDIQTFRKEVQPVLNEGYVVEYGHDKGRDVWARITEKKEPGEGALVRSKTAKMPEFGRAGTEQLSISEEEKGKELAFVKEKEPGKKESWEKRLEEEPKKEEEAETEEEFDKWYGALQEGYDKEIKKTPEGKARLVRVEIKTPDGQVEQIGNLPEERAEAVRQYAKDHGQEAALTIGQPFFGRWEESLTPKEQEKYIRDMIRATEENPDAEKWREWDKDKGELFAGLGIALPKRVRMAIQKGLDKLDVESAFKRLGAKETGLALKLYHPRRNVEIDKGIKAAKELTKKFKGLGRADFEKLTLLASKERKLDTLTPEEQAKYREPLKIVREFFDKYADQLQKLAVIEDPWPYSAIRRMSLELQNYREALKLGSKDPEKLRKEIKDREVAIDFLERAKVKYVHIPRFWLETFWQKNRDNAPKILTEFFRERKTLDLEQLANYLLKEGYIKKSDMDVRKIMLAYSHFAGHKIGLAEIFDNAKKEGLVKPAGEAPDNWVPLQPRRFPTLKGMRMHPELVDYIERNFMRRGAEWMPPYIGNIMGTIKSLQFYNPFNLSQYSAVQTMWTGALTSPKTPKTIIDTFRSMIKKDADYQEAAYWGAFAEPFTPTFRQAERRIEKFMTQNPLKKALKYVNPYELSWTMAWWFENSFKMMSYKGLRKQGFAPKEAAQIAAKTGADYASIPPATRKFLNKILFTPSFTISMIKTTAEMMGAGAKILSHPKLLAEKTPEAKYTRTMARGAMLFAGGLAAREILLHALGFKTDRFGIKYYKTIKDDEGNEKELVVHIPTPDNVILRYAYDLLSIGKADNQLEELANRAKWKLHPIWQLGVELLSKKRVDGQPLYDPTKSDRAEIVKDVLVYSVRRILRISELIPEAGEGSLSKVKAFKALQDDLGKLGGSILSAYSIPYIRNLKERRLMYQMNDLLNFFKQMTLAKPPKNDEEAEKASKWLQEKLEEFQKKFEETQEEKE